MVFRENFTILRRDLTVYAPDLEDFAPDLASFTVNFEDLLMYFASFTLNLEAFTLNLASFASDFEAFAADLGSFALHLEDSRARMGQQPEGLQESSRWSESAKTTGKVVNHGRTPEGCQTSQQVLLVKLDAGRVEQLSQFINKGMFTMAPPVWQCNAALSRSPWGSP